MSNTKVVLIHDPCTVLLFMNFDRTLFITSKALDVTAMDEGELALLIGHELSHYLLEHQVERTFGFLTEVYLRPYWDS
jgi:predicted Zn-dependent protease